MHPLTDLIVERGFDRFQSGLEARFEVDGIQYKLTYCEPTGNAAMRLDFESSLHIGRVTVWESGACHMEALSIETGHTVFDQHHQFNNEQEFHFTYPNLVIFMRGALGGLQADDTKLKIAHDKSMNP
jgi:hypothetical protein